jgi:hypothetical protein
VKSVEKWTVYALKDPRAGEVRYVGWTSMTPARRMTCHLTEAKHEKRSWNTFKVRWIRALLASGVLPIMEVLETGSGAGWSDAERRWIALYKTQTAKLTNGSAGGEGNFGYSPPPEVREKIRQANKGRKLAPEHARKWIEGGRRANTGRVHTAEHNAKIGAAFKGIPRAPHVIAAWHAKHIANGWAKSPEARAKMSISHLGKKDTPETRAKKSAAHDWSTYSPESRQKVLDALGRGARVRWDKCAHLRLVPFNDVQPLRSVVSSVLIRKGDSGALDHYRRETLECGHIVEVGFGGHLDVRPRRRCDQCPLTTATIVVRRERASARFGNLAPESGGRDAAGI